MSRAKDFSVLPMRVLSLLALLSACGRTDLPEDFQEPTPASGGVIGTGGSAASGFRSTGGRYTGGTPSTGGRATGGNPSTGGRAAPSTGGRATGGNASTGGRFSGGMTSTGGRFTGGTLGTGGRVGGGNASTGGTSNTGGQYTGGTSNTGGSASGGQAGSAINTGGAGTGGTGGTGGSSGVSQWYVDAQNGSDSSPGTQALPFKTLNRAATAALAGDTVNLLDGIWDSSIDVKLASSATTDCGLSSGIAFAPNITLRAVNPSNAIIVGAGYHGVCMSGGLVDGLLLDCNMTG